MLNNLSSRYLAEVVKAWAERPESSSEEEEAESERHRKNEKQTNTKRGRSLWRRVSSARKSARKANHLPIQKSNSTPLTSQSDSEAKSGVEDVPNIRSYAGQTHLSPKQLSDPENSGDDAKPYRHEPNSVEVSEDENIDEKEQRPKRSRREVMDLVLRGAARAVGKMKHNAKKPKFNFEKYISYLQNVLPNIGFDIMGIIVTWNMVSAIIFLEVSVLALFVQESIFGNSQATVTL